MKLYNDDCMNIMKTLEDNSVDLVVTDPPYKVTSRGSAGNSGGMLQKKQNKKGLVFKHNNIAISDFLPELYRILKDKSHCYIMCNHKNLYPFLEEINNFKGKDGGKFNFIKSLIWVKDNKIMGQYYMSQFEYILFLRKNGAKKINNCGTSDVIHIANKKLKGADGKNLHDTEKPVELMQLLIENSSNENDIVVDPFMGIGSTGVACKNTNRKFIGIELDEEYFNIASKRILDK